MKTLTPRQIVTLVVLAVALLVVLAIAIEIAFVESRRRFRRWRAKRAIRQQLELYRGGKALPVFTDHGELEERRRSRPPVKSLRKRQGDNDAA